MRLLHELGVNERDIGNMYTNGRLQQRCEMMDDGPADQ